MKSGEEFLNFVHDRARAQTAIRKKKLLRNTGILLSAFAFILICGGVWLRLLPSNVGTQKITFATDTAESATEEMIAASAAGSMAAAEENADGSFFYKSFAMPEAEAADSTDSATFENEERSFPDTKAAPYTVRANFTRAPAVCGYAVEYTDTSIDVTVYTDTLPSEFGSFCFELCVLLDAQKQAQLPIEVEFVLK